MGSGVTQILSEERLDGLRERYASERAKRIRSDGVAQYRKLDDESPYMADPLAEPAVDRAPLVGERTVVIVGSGFAGLLSAIHLRRSGVEDVVIIDKATDFGGTWYWNRYPGLRCDVESYIYLPLLEETGYMPREKYATGNEIHEYIRDLAARHQIRDLALFSTRVTGAAWDEASSRWRIETDRGDLIDAQFVILGTGGLLHRPKIPDVPGIESFKGRSFHTSRWDYEYTGGGPQGGLTGLRGKRVALIGTGATGIQVAPYLAADAEQLFVVQRTPSAIDHRGNRPTDAEWFKNLEPGWQDQRRVNFDSLLAGLPQDHDAVGDRWTTIWGMPDLSGASDPADMLRLVNEHDFAQMERIRARVDEIVDDSATAEALKPYYNSRCKRPTFNDEYLDMFNRENATLVDTNGHGIDRITQDGFVVGDKKYEVDCIIYATGFDAVTSPAAGGGFEVVGREGVELSKKWARDAVSLHGMYTNGFPNLFVLGNVRQSAVTINVPFTTGTQAAHAAAVIAGFTAAEEPNLLEISEAQVDSWQETLRQKSLFNEESAASCTPGFYDNEGDLESVVPLFASAFGGGIVEYRDELAAFRKALLADVPTTNFQEAR